MKINTVNSSLLSAALFVVSTSIGAETLRSMLGTDMNGDGFFTKGELTLSMTNEHAETFLTENDKDGDRRLSSEEMVTALEANHGEAPLD